MQFSQLIGQQKAKDSFFKSMKEGRLPHALILVGPEGIGKLGFATAIAQYLNCLNPAERDSCGKCSSCTKIQKGIHPDVRYVLPILSKKEGDKPAITDDFFERFRGPFFSNPYYSMKDWMVALDGENKQLGIHIGEIRDLKRKLSLKAFEAKYKISIMWNAERINHEASNAFLKLLEEPPDRTILILTVSDPTKLLTTINSRCQRLIMSRVSEDDIFHWLKDERNITEDQARQIAEISEGSVSYALELTGETEKSLSILFFSWIKHCLSWDYESIQQVIKEVTSEGRDFQKLFMAFGLKKFRDTTLAGTGSSMVAGRQSSDPVFGTLSRQMSLKNSEKVSRLMEESVNYLSRNANAQLVFTALSIRLASVLTGKD